MKTWSILFAFLFLPLFLTANGDADELKLKLEPTKAQGTYHLTVVDKYTLWSGDVEIAPNQLVCEELEKGLSFCGRLSEDGRVFRGFIKSGFMHHQVILTQTEQGNLEGNWSKQVSHKTQKRPSSEQFIEVYFAGNKATTVSY